MKAQWQLVQTKIRAGPRSLSLDSPNAGNVGLCDHRMGKQFALI